MSENDKLQFYSKSRDVAPGKGAGEQVANPAVYDGLNRHKDWRKTLSNFHVGPFPFDGKMYNTIEHGFQAAKIRMADAEAAESFSLDSGSELAKGDGAAAQAARKMRMLSKDQVKQWDAISSDVMGRLARAKYRHCEEARQVLLDTLDAELWHFRRGGAVRFLHLEAIRAELRAE
jgi:ribA/ribD-fused uncharacterized protein